MLIKGANAADTRLLARVGTLAPLLAQHHVFAELPDAVAHAAKHINRTTHDPNVAARNSIDVGGSTSSKPTAADPRRSP